MWSSDYNRGRQDARGFTLLELLTVLLLIGFLLGVGLRLDVGLTRNTTDEQLAVLAQQFALAALEAVQAGNVWGLDIHQQGAEGGYRWLVHDGERWSEAAAEMLDTDTAAGSWSADVTASLMIDGVAVTPAALLPLDDGKAAANLAPEILLLPTRENTAFTLVLQEAGATRQAKLTVDALGRATLETADAAQ